MYSHNVTSLVSVTSRPAWPGGPVPQNLQDPLTRDWHMIDRHAAATAREAQAPHGGQKASPAPAEHTIHAAPGNAATSVGAQRGQCDPKN